MRLFARTRSKSFSRWPLFNAAGKPCTRASLFAFTPGSPTRNPAARVASVSAWRSSSFPHCAARRVGVGRRRGECVQRVRLVLQRVQGLGGGVHVGKAVQALRQVVSRSLQLLPCPVPTAAGVALEAPASRLRPWGWPWRRLAAERSPAPAAARHRTLCPIVVSSR